MLRLILQCCCVMLAASAASVLGADAWPSTTTLMVPPRGTAALQRGLPHHLGFGAVEALRRMR